MWVLEVVTIQWYHDFRGNDHGSQTLEIITEYFLKTFRKIVYMILPIVATEKSLLQKLFTFVLELFFVFLDMVKKSTVTSEITSKVGANYHLCH